MQASQERLHVDDISQLAVDFPNPWILIGSGDFAMQMYLISEKK